MIKVMVLHPHADTDYNRNEHAGLTLALPGLRKFTISEVTTDPMTGEAPPFNLVNTLYFDDMESYQRAFSSPEVVVAKADVVNFSDLSKTITLVSVEYDTEPEQ